MSIQTPDEWWTEHKKKIAAAGNIATTLPAIDPEEIDSVLRTVQAFQMDSRVKVCNPDRIHPFDARTEKIIWEHIETLEAIEERLKMILQKARIKENDKTEAETNPGH